MSITPQKQSMPSSIPAEDILVVKRSVLFQNEPTWTGLRQVSMSEYLEIINKHKEFLPRAAMETDPMYKQIIPYLIFAYKNTYFLMQRKHNASEARLQNKFSLGIGGHIRQEDMINNSIIDWAQREFYEEVAYDGELTIEPLGILNDDSNDVGKVHIGFVFLLRGNTNAIQVKSELKQGMLCSLEELAAYADRMESWSQFVYTFLNKQS